MKRQIWIFTHSNAAGGAEKCIDLIKNYQPSEPDQKEAQDFEIRIAVLKIFNKSNSFLKEVTPWWAFLFKKKDVIHSHLFWPGLFIRILKLFSSSPNWIHTVHYADYEGQSFKKIKSFLDTKFIFPKVNRLIFVSETVEKKFPFFLRGKVILNSIDLRKKDFIDSRINKESFVLGCVSQLRTEKGLADLVQIFTEFKKQHPQSRLKIAGDGPCLKQLTELARQNDVLKDIKFCGYVQDLPEFYRDVDVYIQPSRTESFGIAALEALTFGKPVIAANVGHLSVLFNDGRGILVNRDSRFILNSVEALKKVLDNYEFYLSQSNQALSYWQKHISFKGMEAAYWRLYQELTAPAVCMIAPIVTAAKGGLQQQLQLQSYEIQKKGFRIFILQNFDPHLEHFDKNKDSFQSQWRHVEFWQVRQFCSSIQIRGIWFLIRGFIILLKQRKSISIFHAHQLYSPTILGAMGKFLNGAPLVTKVTASGKLGEAANLKKMFFFGLRKRIFKYIDQVFVLTEDMKNEMSLLDIDQSRVRIVSNSVTLPTLETNELKTNRTNEILFVGRLSTEKSIETILYAAIQMHQQRHPVVVKLVGGHYPERDASAVLKGIATKNPEVRIQFLGEQKNVQSFYRERPIFVLASSSEGMSNALLEAMSYGLICVVSDIPANQFLIADTVNGFLFKQADVNSLTSVLIKCQKLSESELLRISSAARKTIEDKFSTKVISDQIVTTYNQLIKQKR